MNFRTTIVLLILAAGGGAAYWYRDSLAAKLGYAQPTSADGKPGTLYILRRIRPDAITRIAVTRDGQTLDLVREGKAWNLPGGWPTRGPEVQELVDLLTGLDSRFEPIPVGSNSDLAPYGLDKKQKPVEVTLTVALPGVENGQSYRLLFGEPPGQSGNRFTRPTYFRLDDQNQVLRSAPGLLIVLDRSQDDYRKRQLFPDVERVRIGAPKPAFPGEPETPQPTVALLEAKRIVVNGPDGQWELHRRPGVGPPPKPGSELSPERLAEDWELTAPAPDSVDPDKLRAALAEVPELWVENFVTVPNLTEAGLDKPERTVKVETEKRTVDLQIGKVSREVEKKAPPPPPPQFGAPPPPPPPPIKEVYRYAKLAGNPQVFEVKADKLGDLFIAPAAIRDPRLVRFRSADVRRVEIARPESQIVLTDERNEAAKADHWKLNIPAADATRLATADADASKVTELLDRISELRATGPDIIDKADAKMYGLESAGPHLTVELSEEKPGDDKVRRPQTITVKIGRHDTEKNKVYVQVAGNPRIDAVADDFLKLFDRPALAYRGRTVIDVAAKQVATIAVQRPGEQFQLEQADGTWKIKGWSADAGKTAPLVNDLSRLEVAEFVNDAPKPDDLAKYGLSTPALSATLTFTDSAMPPKTLQIGGPRKGTPEVYAKLADAPGVFAIRDAIKTTLDQPSLAYRPLQLWQIPPETITAIEVQRGDEKYRLGRDGAAWKITGPFDAPVSAQAAQGLIAQLANVRVEKYEANTAADASKFGFDKPKLKVTVFADKSEPKDLIVGKPAAADLKSRFAKPADADGVVVVPAALTAAIDRPSLDLIDPDLLSLNVNFIAAAHGAGPDGNWELKRDNDDWKITSLTPPATADRLAVQGLLRPWAELRADKFVAYGPTLDWAKYGLDKPAASVSVTMQPLNGGAGESHTLALGKPVEGPAGDASAPQNARYAKLDDRPGVFVLPATVAKEFAQSPLEFVDRKLFAFDPAEIKAIRRTGSAGDLELAKKDDGWQIVKPTAQRADQPTMDELAERLGALRAVRAAALNVTDFKPFGLDAPLATITLALKGKDDKPADKVLHIGGPVPPTDEHFARVDGQSTVFILPAAVAKTLVAEPLKFRDKAIARFDNADRIFIDQGARHVIFAKLEGTWKMTEPMAAEAETTDLGELVTTLSRLRADELVAEKPGDLKEFGLDHLEVHWRLLSGDREVLNLLIGKRDPAAGRNYAKLAAGDMIFFLSPDLSNRLLAEYRKRALWSGLDAAGVETLVYSAGDRTLVLQKVNDSWQQPGKPDQKLNATAINDMVAALAGLKVERFVADKDADLKKYGLQPPKRTIVARTRTGVTATLYLGKTEDGSKRLFARILDPSRTDVFVLSEADSGRLVKDLAAFSK